MSDKIPQAETPVYYVYVSDTNAAAERNAWVAFYAAMLPDGIGFAAEKADLAMTEFRKRFAK